MIGISSNWRLIPLILLANVSMVLSDLPNTRQQQLDTLLAHDCGSCHGLTRSGGLGPALHAQAMEKYSIAALVAVILEGIPDSAMPAWKELLSSEDARYLAEELISPKYIKP